LRKMRKMRRRRRGRLPPSCVGGVWKGRQTWRQKERGIKRKREKSKK